MRRLIAVLTICTLPFLVACEGLPGGDDPVGLVCDLCQALDESGICEALQSKTEAECGAGEILVITNLREAIDDGGPLQLRCVVEDEG